MAHRPGSARRPGRQRSPVGAAQLPRWLAVTNSIAAAGRDAASQLLCYCYEVPAGAGAGAGASGAAWPDGGANLPALSKR